MPRSLPANQEDREVYLRAHDSAQFIEVIQSARRLSAETLVMTVKAFADEPDVLYVALDYAYEGGVAITMAPPKSVADRPMALDGDPRA
jgi:hypothetical protein